MVPERPMDPKIATMKPEKDRSKSKKKSVGGDEASVAKKDKSSRRATFAGSRLSLHSLRFFPSLSKEKETVSRSAADLGDELVLSVGDSGSEADSEVRTTPACKVKMKECPLCFLRLPSSTFPRLSCCPHRSCHSCMVQYLQMEIVESRIVISCPECTELIHPNDIYKLLAEQPHLIQKFEEFSLRRLLLADPDTRWCPAPDCGYAVIASGCAACPELRCERPGCGATFCYHCKMAWHPNQTCDEARTQRGSTSIAPHHFDPAIRPGDIKACPRCHTYIVKMNDGSCNHMVCALCGSEFCWLCLKEISDLHYLSPSGCTFWGKKPWSRKKKLLWQLGTLVGAPVGIALIAGLAVPAIIFGFPVFVGKKVYQKMHDKPQKHRRRMAVIGGVVGSFLISPVLASMAVGVGVPVLLAYVYGVVPLSLCRSGGCGVDSSGSIKLDENDDFYGVANLADQEKASLLREDGQSMAVSNVTAMSIHSGSSASAVAHQGRLHVQVDVCTSTRRRPSIESGAVSLGNYEEASMKAMAGSTHCDDKSVHTMSSLAEGGSYCEDGASTAALAGSVFENKSICAMDNASVRALAGSIAPDTLSAKYHIDRSSPAPLLEEDIVGDLCDNDRDYKHSSEPPHSKRKSIGDNISVPSSSRQSRSRSVCIHQQLSSSSGDDTTDNASRRLLSVSPRYDASGVHPDQDLSSVKEGAEYLMVSTEAIRSIPLHPANASHKKARSASLLDSAPVELWSLLMDSPTEPWSVFSRVREAGTQGKWITTATPYRVTTGSASSYTSLPDPNPSLTPSNPPARSRTFHFPKFAPFSKKSRDKP